MRERRQLFVPEVVQTSAVDCGPACLNALLNGYGRYVSYGRLREACQTNVDGTSIDTIENLANRLGLDTEQIVIPGDHVSLPEAAALPAVVVVTLPTGLTHFVVAWRRHGDRLQIMDPATGRRWTHVDEFANELYSHEMCVPSDAWREWAASPEFSSALKARIIALGINPQEAASVVAEFLAAPNWLPIASLDGGVRMLQSLAHSGTFKKTSRLLQRNCRTNAELRRILVATTRRVLAAPQDALRLIPAEFWSVRPGDEPDQLVVRGAVLVRVKGLNPGALDVSVLPPEIAAAASEGSPNPARELWGLLKREGSFTPAMVAAACVASSVGVISQAVLFRVLVGAAHELTGQGQRIAAMGVVIALLILLLAIDVPIFAALVAMGRRLETRFRVAFLEKLPRIGEEYFHSRLTSDMAERNHSVHAIRNLPTLAGQILRSLLELLFTTAAVICIDPHVWFIAILLAVAAAGIPLAAQPLLAECQLRVRTHAGALSRFYFDALLGMIPIRTHVADRVVRDEHKGLLAKWASAGLETQKIAIASEGLQMFTGFGLAALLVLNHVSRHPNSAAMLLLAFWSLNIPTIGRELSSLAGEYPQYRNIVLRLLEPLGALEDSGRTTPTEVAIASSEKQEGVALSMAGIEVTVGGHQVLRSIDLRIPPGSHVAIVGPSGAGKSSFVGLLLGLRTPASGHLTVDNEPLSPSVLNKLRQQTAWVDPTVQLWHRSLIDNLRFGATGSLNMPITSAVDEAGLTSVLDKLPDGLQTGLGDGGLLVSGGEGQRVRLCRAMLRPGTRLAVLDEPFRGLDPSSRKSLLAAARATWGHATVFFVTHDVADTIAFDRVLVMEGGTIVEDGVPAALVKCPQSRYAQLLRCEIDLKRKWLHEEKWRYFEMRNGFLSEDLLRPKVFNADEAPEEDEISVLDQAVPRRREMIA
jgi:ABC-type bacteriocin/lantibiotic exporter with double-glycine peptidase domain